MDLSRLIEQVVHQEELALQLGMANPSRFVLDELSYHIQTAIGIRRALDDVQSADANAFRSRIDVVIAEMYGLLEAWGSTPAQCALCAA